jgi:hypothetical protein
MWNKEVMNSFLKTRPVQLSAAAAASAMVAASATYVLVKKKLEREYADLSDREIREARAYFAQMNKVEVFSDPETLAAKLYEDETVPTKEPEVSYGGVVDDLDYRSKTNYHKPSEIAVENLVEAAEEMEEAVETVRNVFKDSEPVDKVEFDYDVELANRSPEAPYVISREEYESKEQEYEQAQLAWYIQDDVLADHADDPIEEIESTVGMSNLDKFGHGSGDNNIVYIRNERLELDFEVLRSNASFLEVVHGISMPKDELMHEDRSPRKFRQNRE